MVIKRKMEIFAGKSSDIELDLDGREDIAGVLRQVKDAIVTISTESNDHIDKKDLHVAWELVDKAVGLVIGNERYEVVSND